MTVDRKAYLRDWQAKNKEKVRAWSKKWRKNNRELASLSRSRWKETHPESYLLSTVKYRAKKECLPFDLELSDIFIPKFCPYLGIKLVTIKGTGHLDALASVDRIDPSRGYIKGNVQVISYKANRMKNDATVDELVVFSKSVLKKYEGAFS